VKNAADAMTGEDVTTAEDAAGAPGETVARDYHWILYASGVGLSRRKAEHYALQC
jgi:hypothetical protein